MDPASITLITIGCATLVWSIYQSYRHGHLCQSKCMISYDNENDDINTKH